MTAWPVIAIRPQPGLRATIEAGKAAGLTIEGYPLFAVEPVAWDAPDPSQFDALLIGSANVFRHGGNGLAAFQRLPVLAVGKATAEAAHEAGFDVESVGKGGLQSLIDGHGDAPVRWLRLAGEEHVPLDIPPHISITNCITYRVKPSEFSPELRSNLANGCLVLLHSAAAARHFADSCDALGIDRANIAFAALGPRILEPVGAGWKTAQSAEAPSEEALLALAKRMCEAIS